MKRLSGYLIPDLICETVYEIPFESYFEKGIRAVAFDIDNTLVSYDTPVPPEEVKALLYSLKEKGIPVALVSNNTPKRVNRFNEEMGFFAVSNSRKPLRCALRPVFEEFDLKPEELLFVGDQLLTDVLSAKRWGATAVTVQPIKNVENLFFRFKRLLEKPFRRAYKKRKNRKG